ncbi:MAG: hypothetical protein M3503_01805, partial [Actinomycetota bacterium]|nr:hypothetical protein [Actinomycetota bacterium]
QEVLGSLQDAAVSEAWLRLAAAEVAPAPATVALRMADDERAEIERLRRAWSTAWGAVDHKGLRSWLRT